MKQTKTLRLMDKYAGIIICFIFSIVYYFKKKKRSGNIKNILLMNFFEMGAVVYLYPPLTYINKKLDDPNIYILCTRNQKSCWELIGAGWDSSRIYAINDKNIFAFILSFFKQIHKLRKKDIDIVIDYELFRRVSSIASFIVKAKSRAGFYKYNLEGLYRGNFLDIKCAFNQNSHISKNYLALTRAALEYADNTPNYKGRIRNADLFIPRHKFKYKGGAAIDREIKKIFGAGVPKTIILICPDVGPILPARNYPRDNFIKVINNLLNELPGAVILLTGKKEIFHTCEYIRLKVNSNRCHNFCKKTPALKDLIFLISISDLLICNDSGPIHFAAITKTKVLALFSTDSPFMYGPLCDCVVMYSYFHCSPCISAFNHKTTKCGNNLCLQSIKPQSVSDMALRLLSGDYKTRTINNQERYV